MKRISLSEELTIVKDNMGEAVHTAFRKGCFHESAHGIWSAIHAMPAKDWNGTVDWMIYCLDLDRIIRRVKRMERAEKKRRI